MLVRSGTGMFFASALLALLPSLAHSISGNPIGYGVPLAGFGTSAVLSALVLRGLSLRADPESGAGLGARVGEPSYRRCWRCLCGFRTRRLWI